MIEVKYVCLRCKYENKFHTSQPLICSNCRDCRIFEKKQNTIPILYKSI